MRLYAVLWTVCGMEPCAVTVFIGVFLWKVHDVSHDQGVLSSKYSPHQFIAGGYCHESIQNNFLGELFQLWKHNIYLKCATSRVSILLNCIIIFFFPWPWITNPNWLDGNLLLASVIMNWISAIQHLNKFSILQYEREKVCA